MRFLAFEVSAAEELWGHEIGEAMVEIVLGREAVAVLWSRLLARWTKDRRMKPLAKWAARFGAAFELKQEANCEYGPKIEEGNY